VAAVLFVSDDASMMVQVLDGLEAAGLRISWVGPGDAVPGKPKIPPEVVVLDGDTHGINLVELIKQWRAVDPAPAMVALGSSATAERAAAKEQVPFTRKPFDPRVLGPAIGRAAATRFIGALTRGAALHAVGATPTGDTLRDTLQVVAGARLVSIDLVRDGLRPFADAYVTISSTQLEQLREKRALTIPEVTLALGLDGARTLRTVLQSGGLEPTAALRLMWALASTGVAALSREPPEDKEHARARVTAALRRRLRARGTIVQKARTHYDILELPPDPDRSPDVDAALRHMWSWYAPERLAGYDLGDLQGSVEPYWQQVRKAHQTLADAATCRRYFFWLAEQGIDLTARAQEARMKRPEAEAAFQRGLAAITEGEAFRAVSQLAMAARLDPDEPDYEAFAAWGRYMAELARGNDTSKAVVRELRTMELALLGRRPRPRALHAMGLMAQVAGDTDAARQHLADAIACDPGHQGAQRALARITYGQRA
jgi:CheY-like chemotaxis protein